MSKRTSRWVVALTTLVCCSLWAAPAHAQGEDPPPSDDGPVFLVLDLEGIGGEASGFRLPNDEFQDPGSSIIVIQIGTIIAGPTIFESRYVGRDLSEVDPSEFGLPPDVNFHAAIIGSFRELSGEIHAVNQTSPDDSDPEDDAEVAFFTASSALLMAIDTSETPGQLFTTTGGLADIIVEFQDQGEDGEDATREEILDLIFPGVGGEDPQVVEVVCESPCEAEGDLFPHDDDETEPLFGFQLNIDTDLKTFSFDACTPVDVDIKPDSDNNKINVKSKKGVVPIGILSDDTFDAVDEVDRAAVAIQGDGEDEDGNPIKVTVSAVKTSVKDLNGDGVDDVLAHFKVPELVEAGLLDKNTTELTLVAATNVGGCVTGTDTVGHTGNNK